jgi:hypothetical protein
MTISAVQQGHIKTLEWAIRFCQANLSALREGDWINLKEDLYEFIEYGQHTAALLKAIFPDQDNPGGELKSEFCKRTTEKEIAEVQGGLKRRLSGFAYSRGEQEVALLRKLRHLDTASVRFPFVKDFLPVQRLRITSGTIELQGFRPNEPFRQMISFGPKPNLQIKVDLALFRHLVSSGILRGQLRTCPECGRIFLLRRKPRSDQTFQCSLRCSRNAATRRYRERLAMEHGQEVKAQERERSHRRYVAKQRRKYGPKVKVERRPRNT